VVLLVEILLPNRVVMTEVATPNFMLQMPYCTIYYIKNQEGYKRGHLAAEGTLGSMLY